MDASEIPKKNSLHLKLCKHKQRQGVHKIKLMAKEKEMKIKTKMVEGKVHNTDRGKMQVKREMWVETRKMVEIRL